MKQGLNTEVPGLTTQVSMYVEKFNIPGTIEMERYSWYISYLQIKVVPKGSLLFGSGYGMPEEPPMTRYKISKILYLKYVIKLS